MRTTSRPCAARPSANARQRRRTRPHVVADDHLRGVGADQPGERGADLGNEVLVNFLAHEPTHVVCLDDVLYRRSGPGHSAPWRCDRRGQPSRRAPALHVAPELHSTRNTRVKPECARSGLVGGIGQHAQVPATTAVRAPTAGPAGAVSTPPWAPVTGSAKPAGAVPPTAADCDRRAPRGPRRPSATRSSSSGCDGSGPAWRTSSQPRGAVIRPACRTTQVPGVRFRHGGQRPPPPSSPG